MKTLLKNLMILFFFMVVLTTLPGCGRSQLDVEDSQHIADGEVRFVIDWNLEQMKDFFTNDCEKQFETQEEIDACVQEKIDNLLDFLNGIDEKQKETK